MYTDVTVNPNALQQANGSTIWYSHPQGKLYSAMKRNEQLILGTTRMDLKGFMTSEKSQSQKVTYCMIPFT